MRTFLISAALISSVAFAAAPASAQWAPQRAEYTQQRYGQGNGDIRRDIDQLASRIQRAEQRGAITRREAANLRESLNVLQDRYRQYSRGGLNRYEYARLQERMDDLVRNLREERQDGRRDDRRDDRRDRRW